MQELAVHSRLCAKTHSSTAVARVGTLADCLVGLTARESGARSDGPLDAPAIPAASSTTPTASDYPPSRRRAGRCRPDRARTPDLGCAPRSACVFSVRSCYRTLANNP